MKGRRALVADLSLDNAILEEAASPNSRVRQGDAKQWNMRAKSTWKKTSVKGKAVLGELT